MQEKKVKTEDLKLNLSKCDKYEVEFWKKKYLAKESIPQPIVNENLEVIGFFNCAAVLKEVGVEESLVQVSG